MTELKARQWWIVEGRLLQIETLRRPNGVAVVCFYDTGKYLHIHRSEILAGEQIDGRGKRLERLKQQIISAQSS